MRVLALDIGDIRCGIAISDPAGKVASPVCVLPTMEVLSGAKSFQRILEDWEPEELVCGLPVSMSGEEGHQAAHIREMAEQIASAAMLPLSFADERLSSAEAKRILRESGLNEKSMRGRIDSVAASLILQGWLDARNSRNE